MFLLLSLILISLSCVNAEYNNISSDVNVADTSLTKLDNYDSVKEANSQIHNIDNNEDWDYVTGIANELTGTHTIELNNKELIVNKEFDVYNRDLELIFNGNGNQLTLHNQLSFDVKSVSFNNLIIECDNDAVTKDYIMNYGKMSLNNVTIKNPDEYNHMKNVFIDKDYDFEDFNGETDIFTESTRQSTIVNNGELLVKDCHFVNNSCEWGTAFINHGQIFIDNSVFENLIGKYSIIHSTNDAFITNCDFINNRVFQQLILATENTTLINNTFKNNFIAGSCVIDSRDNTILKNCVFDNNNVKYVLIEITDYMEASNLSLYNNTCETLINSFGNLTLKNSLIKDNTCSRAIIGRDTLYSSIESETIDKAGNVTLIDNKIFRGNVEYTDFWNNVNTGVIYLYNNTIYDKPDYVGDCIFDGNIFVVDDNLYDDEGNYHGLKREIEIGSYKNYEIVEGENQNAHITFNPMDGMLIRCKTLIKGNLSDETGKAISYEEVFISITDPNGNKTFFNPYTDVNGKFSINYTPTMDGKHNINARYVSTEDYSVSEYDMEVMVYPSLIKCKISLDPLLSKYYLGDRIVISGNLTDENNNPIANKTITITVDDWNSYYLNGMEDYSNKTVTDENGAFNHTYITRFEGKIYVHTYLWNTIYICSSKVINSSVVDSKLIESNLTLNPLFNRLNLDDTLNITGKLTDINNNPLANKTIQLFMSGGESDFGLYSYEFNTTTDEKGIYSYPHKLVNEGSMTLHVVFNDTEYSFSEQSAGSYVSYLIGKFSLDSMASTANLGDNIIISGNLTDSNNVSLANYPVKINLTYDNSNNSILEYVKTDSNGRYFLNYTPKVSGKLNIQILSLNYYASDSPEATIIILDNGTDNDNDNSNNPNDNSIKDTNQKKHNKIISTHKTYKKPSNTSLYKKLPNKIILKIDRQVTLSLLNDIFKDDFKNKTLLIYIDDILVFNGTVSDNPSDVLFKVLGKYKGEHLLKVIGENDTYQKEVTII